MMSPSLSGALPSPSSGASSRPSKSRPKESYQGSWSQSSTCSGGQAHLAEAQGQGVHGVPEEEDRGQGGPGDQSDSEDEERPMMPSDLELWAAQQLTLWEQIATVEAIRMVEKLVTMPAKMNSKTLCMRPGKLRRRRRSVST